MINLSTKKNVLIFSVAYDPFIGGAEVAVKEIIKRLKDFHFTIITLRMDRKLPKFEQGENYTIYRIGLTSSSSNSNLRNSLNWSIAVSKYLFPFQALLKAYTLNKKFKFNLTWSIMANYAGFAALFFKITHPKVPFLLTLQEGDPIEHIKKKVGIFMPVYKMIFRKADDVQAISSFLGNFANRMGYSKEPKIVPNGVDLENFSKSVDADEIKEAREKMEKKENDIFLITSSRLVKKNAVDTIVRSLKFLPNNFKLFIAGEGNEEGPLKDLAKNLDLVGRVKFGGFVSHTKLPAFLQASDIFVRPSRSEGLGNSFLEAFAAGIPVIATNVGGIVDFLRDGQTGLFCQVDNPEDLAKQVEKIQEDQSLRNKIVENSTRLVKEEYSWNTVSSKMKDIFDNLCVPYEI